MSDSPPIEPRAPSPPLSSPPEPPLEIDVGSPEARDFAIEAEPAPASGASSIARVPSLRSASDTMSTTVMTSSSTPLGSLAAARRPPGGSRGASALPSSMQDKMRAFQLSRQGTPVAGAPGLPSPVPPGAGGIPHGAIAGSPIAAAQGGSIPMGGALPGGPGALRLPGAVRPLPINANSAPAVPGISMGMGGLAAKRGLGKGLKLSAMSGSGSASPTGGRDSPANGGPGAVPGPKPTDNAFAKFADIVDTATGTLNFRGKATVHESGVDFASGSSFSISLNEVDTLAELGKGNYGTVYKVRHSRPRMRVPGQGLLGNKSGPPLLPTKSTMEVAGEVSTAPSAAGAQTSGVVMAMKELRLELEDSKFAAILMELDVLHRCASPFVVDFYGAFFQEGAVYICMEFMDGGSIDKLYGGGMPEHVLRKVALSTVMGLKALKDDHNIIHRDVKPTNILMNSRGQVKICDFGVSGNLVASIAKTNIGCQSYMAPERISSGGLAQAGANPGGGTYSVQSDVWSLGLTLIECAMGRYPYPPETYNNIFSQLSAIVEGDPPDLPAEGYSDQGRSFVRACLHKVAKMRPTYAMLLRHAWLAPLMKPPQLTEDAEAESAAEAGEDTGEVGATRGVGAATAASARGSTATPDTSDAEVAVWVVEAMEQRRQGKLARAPPPALHTAPLDAVATPSPGEVPAQAA